MQYIRPTSQVILEVVSIVAQDQREEREARLELETRYNAFVEALRVEQETILSYFDRVFGRETTRFDSFTESWTGRAERGQRAIEDGCGRHHRNYPEQPANGVRGIPEGPCRLAEDHRALRSSQLHRPSSGGEHPVQRPEPESRLRHLQLDAFYFLREEAPQVVGH